MSSSRTRVLVIVGVLVAGLLGVAIWLGLSWLGTYRQAETVQAQVEVLRASVSAQDWAAAVDQVPGVADSAQELADATASAPWRALEAVPAVGATATATHQLAVSLADVLGAAAALGPYAERLVSGEIRGTDGSLDLAAFTDVAPLLNKLAVSLELGQERLRGIDTAAVRDPIGAAVVEFSQVAGEYQGTVERAADIAARVPALLGTEGPRDWLILLQNPAETRGSGGFPGGYVTLRADDGAISVAGTGTSGDLNTTEIPYSSAPEDAQDLWGTELGHWNTYNLSPHFPMTGELSAAGMAERGTPVSGVVALDPAVVAGLMAITGPVTAMGQTVTAENVEQFFLKDVYDLYPDPVERDVVSMALVGAVLDAFLSAPWEPQALVDALRAPVEEGRLRVWSAGGAEQEWLGGTTLGGVLPTEYGPTVAVAFNNSAGNKMDAFIETAIDYSPGLCAPGRTQSSGLSVTLRNVAPKKLPSAPGYYGRLDDPDAPEGSTSLLVHTYLPRDAEVTSATLDGQEVEWYGGDERNHPIAWLKVPIERGQERVLELAFDEPTTVDARPRLIVQPMAIDTVPSITPVGSC